MGNAARLLPGFMSHRLAVHRGVSAVTVLAIVMVLAGLLGLALAQTFPVLTGRVVDIANLLSPEQEAALTAQLAALEQKSTDQLVVVTLPTLQGYAIEDYGVRLGRHWRIGQAGKDNGALLIVAPNDRKVRVEVGRGLEPVLTDALTSVIIQRTILPRFRRGDFPGGIAAGVKDLTDAMTGDAAEVERRARGSGSGQPQSSFADYIPLLVFGAFAGTMLYGHFSETAAARRRRLRRKGLAGTGSSAGSWSGGGWSGGSGSGGGGGWSGGGGGFGGGGSSGGW